MLSRSRPRDLRNVSCLPCVMKASGIPNRFKRHIYLQPGKGLGNAASETADKDILLERYNAAGPCRHIRKKFFIHRFYKTAIYHARPDAVFDRAPMRLPWLPVTIFPQAMIAISSPSLSSSHVPIFYHLEFAVYRYAERFTARIPDSARPVITVSRNRAFA